MTKEDLDKKVDEWLSANQKKEINVLCGTFPIGMVGRWIERAEKAEAEMSTLLKASEGMEKALEPFAKEAASWNMCHQGIVRPDGTTGICLTPHNKNCIQAKKCLADFRAVKDKQ